MQVQPVYLNGITEQDIQDIIRRTIREFKGALPHIMTLDGNYLYSFDKSDVPFVNKFVKESNLYQKWIKEGNRWLIVNPHIIEWHTKLENWFIGDYQTIYGKRIKPLQISRTFDRVPNECLELIAGSFTGQDFTTMAYHGIGSGAEAGTSPSPADTQLAQEINRINVITDQGGGTLSRTGTTFYCVGNHPISVESADITETGIFDREKPALGEDDVPTTDDRMGDHAIFPNKISHDKGQDAVGGTTVIYICSS